MRNFKISDDSQSSKSSINSSEYDRYKKSLHAFFDGKIPLPSYLSSLPAAEIIAPEISPAPALARKSRLVAKTSKGEQTPLNSIRSAATKQEICAAIDLMTSLGQELPCEEEILSKALCHDSNIMKRQVLDKIEALIANSTLKNPKLLRSRLENAALLAKSQDIHNDCLRVRDIVRDNP